MADTCRGPRCDRSTIAHGLCPSHYRQEQRGRPLTEIGARSPPRERVSLRLSAHAIDRVREDYAGAVEAVERWARK